MIVVRFYVARKKGEFLFALLLLLLLIVYVLPDNTVASNTQVRVWLVCMKRVCENIVKLLLIFRLNFIDTPKSPSSAFVVFVYVWLLVETMMTSSSIILIIIILILSQHNCHYKTSQNHQLKKAAAIATTTTSSSSSSASDACNLNNFCVVMFTAKVVVLQQEK